MELRKLQRTVVDALEDVKAQDIRVFDTTARTSEFERVIIASGTSNRQTRALAASVHDKVRALKGRVHSVEGQETGEWVLVDLGSIIVHIMQPAIRQYYNLEELWGAKPVRVKLTPNLPTAAASEDEEDDSEAESTPRAASSEPTGRGATTRPVIAGRAPRRKVVPVHALAPSDGAVDATPLGHEDELGEITETAAARAAPKARYVASGKPPRPGTRKLAPPASSRSTGTMGGTRRTTVRKTPT